MSHLHLSPAQLVWGRCAAMVFHSCQAQKAMATADHFLKIGLCLELLRSEIKFNRCEEEKVQCEHQEVRREAPCAPAAVAGGSLCHLQSHHRCLLLPCRAQPNPLCSHPAAQPLLLPLPPLGSRKCFVFISLCPRIVLIICLRVKSCWEQG